MYGVILIQTYIKQSSLENRVFWYQTLFSVETLQLSHLYNDFGITAESYKQPAFSKELVFKI